MEQLFPFKVIQPTSSNKVARSNGAGRISRVAEAGKVRMGALLWALGLPIPLVLLFLLFRGCA